jgi:predicted nucleic acid-binding protein
LKIALDSSVLVDYLAKGAARHTVTRACYQRYRAEGAEFIVAEHAILEAFAVLSRSPQPIGMDAREAELVLWRDFGLATIAPVRTGIAWDTIRHTLARNHWGGRVYDAVIALSVFEAGATVLLTWNLRHFLTIAPAGLEVRQPA